MAKSKTSVRKITLTGLTPIMFDRYAGDNKTQLTPDQKLYLNAKRQIVLPATNIMSLLTASNTPSAPKRFLDARTYKKTAAGILSYTNIAPYEIPFLRDGEPIVFGGFDSDGRDATSGCFIHHGVARLEKGIPNPKARPTLPTPWTLQFDLSYRQNPDVTEEMVLNLLDWSGAAIGLGTFRGVFGKFVTTWE
jgi:hypothetical protein